MNSAIDAVIVDTSAYEKEQFDFLGIYSSTVPSFLSLLEEMQLNLLSHPILQEEIKKHILNSKIVQRVEEFPVTISRNKNILSLIGISPETITEKLKTLDLAQKLTSAFESVYQRALMLPYPDPKNIFDAYFSNRPPFSAAKNKKSEFPDAFVLEAIKKYLKGHPYSSIIAISDDSDWADALEGTDRVILVSSIDDAIKAIRKADNIMAIREVDDILPIFRASLAAIERDIESEAMYESYDIPEYILEDIIDIPYVECAGVSEDIVPLRITNSSVLLKTMALLKIDGSAVILDEDRSVWDKETGQYFIRAYSLVQFENAEAEVECEIKLIFSPEAPEQTVVVKKAQIVSHYNIEIDMSGADVEINELYDAH